MAAARSRLRLTKSSIAEPVNGSVANAAIAFQANTRKDVTGEPTSSERSISYWGQRGARQSASVDDGLRGRAACGGDRSRAGRDLARYAQFGQLQRARQ